MDIKDFLPEQAKFCEYTLKVVACIMRTGKERLGSDIWPQTPNQGTSTENMIYLI